MALHGGELVRRLVDRLYAATTTKEARLCKASLEALVGADIEGGAFAEQAEKPIPEKVVEANTVEVAQQCRRQTTRSPVNSRSTWTRCERGISSGEGT